MTPRQQRFVEEYLVDLNATQAAIRAGYSAETARSIGQQILTKLDIQDAIASAMADRTARTGVTQDYVLSRLKAEAERVEEGGSPGARVRALELLGKHLGMFTERHDVTHRGCIVVDRRAALADRVEDDGDGSG